MATKMFFDVPNCAGATSGATGREYNADKSGFINVTDPTDVACLKSGGYMIAGGMPRVSKYWVCDDCSWESNINHCRYCDSTDLRKVER